MRDTVSEGNARRSLWFVALEISSLVFTSRRRCELCTDSAVIDLMIDFDPGNLRIWSIGYQRDGKSCRERSAKAPRPRSIERAFLGQNGALEKVEVAL